jgi:DNA-binding transcriptional MocR family regulator
MPDPSTLTDRSIPRASLSTLLCNALATDIASRKLLPGDELPTQRLLAKRLGLSLGTIHRTYREASHRGLIRGEVGRGSFVLEPQSERRLSRLAVTTQAASRSDSGPVDLSRNLSLPQSLPVALQRKIRDTVAAVAVDDYIKRDPAGGTEVACAAGSAWVRSPRANETLVVGGAQLALNAILCTLTKPGDTILADSLSFPGLRLAAAHQHVRVVALTSPPGRPDPEALEAAVRKHKPVLWFCIPTLHNPTATIMSSALRRQLADVANYRGLSVVEDDVYGFLSAEPLPSLAAQCEYGIHLVSMAKSTLAGLRIAYINTNPEIAARLRYSIEALCWMTPPPSAALSTALVTSGTAQELAIWKRTELTARLLLARELIGRRVRCDGTASLHVWVSLPDRWNTTSFTAECERQGVLVGPADEFRTTSATTSPNNVRISIGGPATRKDLVKALTIVNATLQAKR